MNSEIDLLMEKLRCKAGAYKSFKEYSKNLKMTLLEKRYALEISEKSYLQQCLELLNQNMVISSLPVIIERLEDISRQLGLKFVCSSSGLEWYISSEEFCLEVVMSSNGQVKEVKIHHDGQEEQQNCEGLLTSIGNLNFKDFASHLESLKSTFNLNAEKKMKCKAFIELQYMESEIESIAQVDLPITDPFKIVHLSQIGFIEKRHGGHPMKITYFIPPNRKNQITSELYDSKLIEPEISGYKVLVCLQNLPSMTEMDEKSSLIFDESVNSNLTPTCFMLKLPVPIAMCEANVSNIVNITGLQLNKSTELSPILELINGMPVTKHKIRGGSYRLPTVRFADQNQYYMLTENHPLKGYMIYSIPFHYSRQLVEILTIMRQQVIFNTIVQSFIRNEQKPVNNRRFKKKSSSSDLNLEPCVKEIKVEVKEEIKEEDLKTEIKEEDDNINPAELLKEKMTTRDFVFEVIPQSPEEITVTFKYLVEDCLGTVELNLSNVRDISCEVHTASGEDTPALMAIQECTNEVFQQWLSIPLMMRTLVQTSCIEGKAPIQEEKETASSDCCVSHLNMDEGGNIPNVRNPDILRNDFTIPDFDPNTISIKVEATDSTLDEFQNFPGLMDTYSSDNDYQSKSLSLLGFESMDSAISGASSFGTSVLPVCNNQDSLLFDSKRDLTIDLTVDDLSFENEFFSTLRRTAESKGNNMLEISSVSDPNSDKALLHNIKTEECSPPSLDFDAFNELDLDTPVKDVNNVMREISDFDDVDQLLNNTDKNDFDKDTTSSLIAELDIKNLTPPPGVSITPVSTSLQYMSQEYNNPVLNSAGTGSDKRQDVDLNSITSSLPSSITITPVSAKEIAQDRAKYEKKSRSKSADDKHRSEKKKKRKHDDSPMGPPEKIPAKSDPMLKPVSVSIKPADSSSPRSASPISNSHKKYNASPTQSTTVTFVGKLSPGGTNSSITRLPSVSPPSYVNGSPKMSSSPKHGNLSSPKHGAYAGSGKPSMSTLKCAVSSPCTSGKSGSESSKSKSHSREHKEKKGSNHSGHHSPKTKSSSGKSKNMDINMSNLLLQAELDDAYANSYDAKLLGFSQQKNRKGSLSAVIDKLKNSARHCVDSSGEDSNSSGSCKSVSSNSKLSSQSSSRSDDTKVSTTGKTPGEYMVKPSQDGMKLTINKTRCKDNSDGRSSSRSSANSSSSSKYSTGSKSNSGGSTSRKSANKQNSGSSSSRSNASSKHSSSKHSSTSSKASKSSKSSESRSHGNSDSHKKEKSRSKSHSERASRKSSPAPTKDDKSFQSLGMIKQLDTKFQIPKLSARSSNQDTESHRKIDSGYESTRSMKNSENSRKNDLSFSSNIHSDVPEMGYAESSHTRRMMQDLSSFANDDYTNLEALGVDFTGGKMSSFANCDNTGSNISDDIKRQRMSYLDSPDYMDYSPINTNKSDYSSLGKFSSGSMSQDDSPIVLSSTPPSVASHNTITDDDDLLDEPLGISKS